MSQFLTVNLEIVYLYKEGKNEKGAKKNDKEGATNCKYIYRWQMGIFINIL